MVLNMLVGRASIQPINVQAVHNLLGYEPPQIVRDENYAWNMFEERRKVFAHRIAQQNKIDKKYRFLLTNDEKLARILAEKHPFAFIVIFADTYWDGTIRGLRYYRNDGGD